MALRITKSWQTALNQGGSKYVKCQYDCWRHEVHSLTLTGEKKKFDIWTQVNLLSDRVGAPYSTIEGKWDNHLTSNPLVCHGVCSCNIVWVITPYVFPTAFKMNHQWYVTNIFEDFLLLWAKRHQRWIMDTDKILLLRTLLSSLNHALRVTYLLSLSEKIGLQETLIWIF